MNWPEGIRGTIVYHYGKPGVGPGETFQESEAMEQQRPAYLTLSGLPLSFAFEWPFHKSTSGADFWVLHGAAYLEDGSGLRADFSIHLTQTMYTMLPNMEPQVALPYVINVVRKMVDTKDLEFLKSGKRQPIQLSSRFKNFKKGTWDFGAASDDEIRETLRQAAYWIGHKMGRGKVLIADETNALYLGTTKEKLMAQAEQLGSSGWIRLEGEHALPTQLIATHADEFEKLEQENLGKLQQKHAFESAHKH